MSDVIHATARAVEIIRARSEMVGARRFTSHRACDDAELAVPDVMVSFAGREARWALAEEHDEAVMRFWPTCAHCRVLLDEAWEHPVEANT